MREGPPQEDEASAVGISVSGSPPGSATKNEPASHVPQTEDEDDDEEEEEEDEEEERLFRMVRCTAMGLPDMPGIGEAASFMMFCVRDFHQCNPYGVQHMINVARHAYAISVDYVRNGSPLFLTDAAGLRRPQALPPGYSLDDAEALRLLLIAALLHDVCNHRNGLHVTVESLHFDVLNMVGACRRIEEGEDALSADDIFYRKEIVMALIRAIDQSTSAAEVGGHCHRPVGYGPLQLMVDVLLDADAIDHMGTASVMRDLIGMRTPTYTALLYPQLLPEFPMSIFIPSCSSRTSETEAEIDAAIVRAVVSLTQGHLRHMESCDHHLRTPTGKERSRPLVQQMEEFVACCQKHYG